MATFRKLLSKCGCSEDEIQDELRKYEEEANTPISQKTREQCELAIDQILQLHYDPQTDPEEFEMEAEQLDLYYARLRELDAKGLAETVNQREIERLAFVAESEKAWNDGK